MFSQTGHVTCGTLNNDNHLLKSGCCKQQQQQQQQQSIPVHHFLQKTQTGQYLTFRKRDSSVITAITLRVKWQNKWGSVPGRESHFCSPNRNTLQSRHTSRWHRELTVCRSQWPCGLRRRSAAARLLGLWVRIPPGARKFVCCELSCQVEVSATSWSLVQRSPTDCGASLCVI